MDLDMFLCMIRFSPDLYEPIFLVFLSMMHMLLVLKYYLLPLL
jgi:hypothetical protein